MKLQFGEVYCKIILTFPISNLQSIAIALTLPLTTQISRTLFRLTFCAKKIVLLFMGFKSWIFFVLWNGKQNIICFQYLLILIQGKEREVESTRPWPFPRRRFRVLILTECCQKMLLHRLVLRAYSKWDLLQS